MEFNLFTCTTSEYLTGIMFFGITFFGNDLPRSLFAMFWDEESIVIDLLWIHIYNSDEYE